MCVESEGVCAVPEVQAEQGVVACAALRNQEGSWTH